MSTLKLIELSREIFSAAEHPGSDESREIDRRGKKALALENSRRRNISEKPVRTIGALSTITGNGRRGNKTVFVAQQRAIAV